MTRLSCVLMTLCVLAGSAQAGGVPKLLQTAMQQVVERYLQESGQAEHVTGVAASVWVPHPNAPEILSVYRGRTGYEPFGHDVSKDTLFEIGSITKSFTAALLLQLQSEGVLSLDDPLGKWLPQYTRWRDVRIRELLNMTSGIPGYTQNEDFFKLVAQNLQADWTDEELVSYAVAPKNQPAPVRGQFDYSNTNYVLAALVVEAATHDAFSHQLQTRLLDKFLSDTFYPAGKAWQEVQDAILPRKARGYYFDEANKRAVDITENNLSWASGAGALVSTTDDVLRWVHTLFHAEFVPESSRPRVLRELLDVVSMQSGAKIPRVEPEDPYAFGLGVGYVYDAGKAHRYFVYEGGTLGFRMMYVFDPCNEVATAVALNSKTAANGDEGDNIYQLNMALYDAVLTANPQLQCHKTPPPCALLEVGHDQSC